MKKEPMVAQSESQSSEKIVPKNVRKKGNASMNKHLAESDLATPKVTTGPIASLTRFLRSPTPRARPESAPLRMSSGCVLPSRPCSDLRSVRPLHRSRRHDRRGTRPAAPAHRVGPRTRRRRGPHQAAPSSRLNSSNVSNEAPRPHDLCQYADAAPRYFSRPPWGGGGGGGTGGEIAPVDARESPPDPHP